MSQHEAPDIDRQTGSRRDWKLFPLLLIPMACCGLPLLIASMATAGALAWGLGLSAAGIVGVAGVTVAVIARRRSRCSAGVGSSRDSADLPVDRSR